MIVSEKDSTWTKIKWYIVCFVGSIIILVLLGGVLPFLVIKYYSTIVGGILFLPCFWGAGKLCFMLENYIGISCSLQKSESPQSCPGISGRVDSSQDASGRNEKEKTKFK